jgi:uncharacterized membrane protein YeaQ/YmgE (transglycosylase-associated protein family)
MLLTLILGIVGTATQAALIGHWKLDEGSGATTADSSASGNNGRQHR